MLSWNGDIHEFLNVYQKNMTGFQDEVNSHLSWLNDDLYLDSIEKTGKEEGGSDGTSEP